MFTNAMSSESKGMRRFKKIIPVIIAIAVLLTSAFSVAALSKNASVIVDGDTIPVSTLTGETEDILEKAMVTLGAHDTLTRTEDSYGNICIEVNRAFALTIMEDGEYITVVSTGGVVSEALEAAGIENIDVLKVEPSLETALAPEMLIYVYRPISVTVIEGESKTSYDVYEGTVSSVFEQIEAPLSEEDILGDGLDRSDWVKDGQTIKVTRVDKEEITEKKAIPFETETKKSDDLYVGETKIQQKGVDGEMLVTTRRVLKDGKVESSEVIEEKITKEAVNQILLKGTKEKVTEEKATTASSSSSSSSSSSNRNTSPDLSASQTLTEKDGVLYDANGKEVSYKKVLRGSATAYCADPGALTATGVPAYVGGVAVNPNIIPYGSKLYIVCDGGVVYGYATAVDTGGALMAGTALVDLYYNSYNECVQFGRRTATIYILS